MKETEKFKLGESLPLAQVLDRLPYNSDGLIPAVSQQYDTGEVLMMAWMNRFALEETLELGRVCYWSRSRQKLWRKVNPQGQIQLLKEMSFDCDGDTILLKGRSDWAPPATPADAAVFTMWFAEIGWEVAAEVMIDPEKLYGR